MKKKFYLSIIALVFFNVSSFAQAEVNLLGNWDYKRKDRIYEKINKVIATTNGYVIAVGETLGDSYKDLDGLFIVMGTEEGTRYQWKKFGGSGNQSFHSVVQNHDGTFTLVGYHQEGNKGDIDGWVVQLDLEGNVLFEGKPDGNSNTDDELFDVAINARGEILAIGTQEDKKSTNVWAVNIGVEKINNDFIIGNGELGKVHGLTVATDDGFTLVGTTSDKNRVHLQDAWVKKIDAQGKDLWGSTKYFGDKGLQEGRSIAATAQDGGFAVLGSTNTQSEGMTDMWLIKLDENGEKVWDKTYGGHAADVGVSLAGLSDGGFAIMGHTWSHMPRARTSTLKLIVTDPRGNELDASTYIIRDGVGDEEAACVIELFSNDNLIIVGNTQPEKSDVFPTTYLGAITYKNIEDLSISGVENDRFGSDLNSSLSLSSAILKDVNQNNFLEANERGYLELEIANNYSTDLYNITAKVSGSSAAAELKYWESVKVGALKAGQKKKVFVPVAAQGSLSAGTYELNIDVDANGTYAARATASVTSNAPNPASLFVQRFAFVPNSNPQPGQPVKLNVTLVNRGGAPTEAFDAYFGLPQGVRPLEPQTVSVPSMRPNDQRQVSFSFVYDQNFRRNVIDVVFQTKSNRMTPVFERLPLEINPLSTEKQVANVNRPTSNSGRQMNDMMVWMSHDPDDKGSRNFETNSKDVDIKLKILTSREIDRNKISVYINGNKSQGQKMDEVKLTSEGSGAIGRYNYQNRLRLREGQNKVRVVYQDAEGNDFSSPELVFDYAPKDKPNLYVLSIGVKHQDLQYTVKDAVDFANIYGKFRDSKNRQVFKKVEVIQITSPGETTANNIKAAFIRLSRLNIKDGDLVVVFISSHGKVNNRGEFILIPSDYNSELEEIYSVNFREDILKKLRVVDGNKLIFIDACHSGSALAAGSRSISDAAASQMLGSLMKASSGIEIIASCGENEYSYEDKKWGNGAFTKSILEAFQGQTVEVEGKRIAADIFDDSSGFKRNGKDGVITIEELKNFIQQRVPYLVKTTKVAPPTEQRPSNKSTELLPDDMGIFVVDQNN